MRMAAILGAGLALAADAAGVEAVDAAGMEDAEDADWQPARTSVASTASRVGRRRDFMGNGYLGF